MAQQEPHSRDGGDDDEQGEEPGESDDAIAAELVDGAELPDLSEARELPQRPLLDRKVSKSTLLARYDPLEAYMRDVQRYKLLTPEEEHAAAVKYFKEGDLEAARICAWW
jgi:RNA polymerase sigma-32 factor